METGNVDVVSARSAQMSQAAEEPAWYLDAGLQATRHLLAAFLNDLKMSA